MAVDSVAPSCGFLSTYPPTPCGLASFTASLHSAICALTGPTARHGHGVVRVVDAVDAGQPPVPPVVHHHSLGSPASLARTVEILGGHDAVIVQHEYGIYGGADGAEIVEILRGLRVPTIVVLHTVLTAPSPNQRRVLERVAHAASAVVTMTRSARRRLLEGYDVDPGRVVVIPHGAHDVRRPRQPQPLDHPPTILTWGLLGPGKGIERALEAVAGLSDVRPAPRYIVAGRTHPKVRESSGEEYRMGLRAQADDLGLADQVVLHDGYRDVEALGRIICSADVVLLPYDSREQVTSGVLIEAVTAGRPVVATAFPHAVELLGGGAGLVVPHDDPAAMTSALRRVLTDRELAARMAAEADRLAPQMLWSAVAARYLALASELARRSQTSAVA